MTILKELGLFEGPVDKLARQSFSGMAHFAGTGPRGATCKQCRLWDNDPVKSPDAPKAQCKKYQQITNHPGNEVPSIAAACKYFEARKSK
jgi:hypothetical protein